MLAWHSRLSSTLWLYRPTRFSPTLPLHDICILSNLFIRTNGSVYFPLLYLCSHYSLHWKDTLISLPGLSSSIFSCMHICDLGTPFIVWNNYFFSCHLESIEIRLLPVLQFHVTDIYLARVSLYRHCVKGRFQETFCLIERGTNK